MNDEQDITHSCTHTNTHIYTNTHTYMRRCIDSPVKRVSSILVVLRALRAMEKSYLGDEGGEGASSPRTTQVHNIPKPIHSTRKKRIRTPNSHTHTLKHAPTHTHISLPMVLTAIESAAAARGSPCEQGPHRKGAA